MPRKGQRSVTLPEWVVELAEEYFERHKEELAKRRPPIKSVTRLIRMWIEREATSNLAGANSP